MTRHDGFFDELGAYATHRNYEKGQEIYRQGDKGNSIFRVEHGNVKLSVAAKRSKRNAVTILRAGDCFGEACLFEVSSHRRGTATSIRGSTIGRIGKPLVMKRLHEDTAFAKSFIRHLLVRITRVEDDLVDQVMNSSERRLARLLWHLTDLGRTPQRPHSDVNVDQATLAQVVGTTRSRVSYFMNRFRKQRLIDYNGSLRVHKALLTFLLRQELGSRRRRKALGQRVSAF